MRNITVIGMVRSMMSRTRLPGFLWGEALKTANYILNRVPSKSVSTTPFEVLYGRMPSFGHIFGDARQRIGSIIQKKESWT